MFHLYKLLIHTLNTPDAGNEQGERLRKQFDTPDLPGEVSPGVMATLCIITAVCFIHSERKQISFTAQYFIYSVALCFYKWSMLNSLKE